MVLLRPSKYSCQGCLFLNIELIDLKSQLLAHGPVEHLKIRTLEWASASKHEELQCHNYI